MALLLRGTSQQLLYWQVQDSDAVGEGKHYVPMNFFAWNASWPLGGGGGKPNKSPSDPNNNFDGREFLHLSDVQHVREYLFILVKNMSLYQVTKWTTPPRQYFRYTARQKSRNPFAWSSFVVVIKIPSSSMHRVFFSQKNHGDGKIAGGASKGYGWDSFVNF